MKKAEVIKNGNVNLQPIRTYIDENGSWMIEFKKSDIENIKKEFEKSKPIKTGIDWKGVKLDFFDSGVYAEIVEHETINVDGLFNWFKKRIEKELLGTL